MRTASWITLILLVALGGRALSAQAQAGTIVGTIVARDGGRPVPDGSFVVDGANITAVANGVGRFRLENVPAGPVVLTATGPGYLQLRVPDVQVRAGETTTLVIELEVTPNILERVHVTATKSELSIGDVAAQTDVVDRSTIDSRNVMTLVKAVEHVPGAVVATQLGSF